MQFPDIRLSIFLRVHNLAKVYILDKLSWEICRSPSFWKDRYSYEGLDPPQSLYTMSFSQHLVYRETKINLASIQDSSNILHIICHKPWKINSSELDDLQKIIFLMCQSMQIHYIHIERFDTQFYDICILRTSEEGGLEIVYSECIPTSTLYKFIQYTIMCKSQIKLLKHNFLMSKSMYPFEDNNGEFKLIY